jgi:hypothetical protein
MAQEKPVHEVRLGKVKAAVWKNDTESGVRYGVTFSRIYKTESGWESSTSFGRDELPLVCKVADMAHTWIYQQNDRSESSVKETGKNSKPSSTRRDRAATH